MLTDRCSGAGVEGLTAPGEGMAHADPGGASGGGDRFAGSNRVHGQRCFGLYGWPQSSDRWRTVCVVKEYQYRVGKRTTLHC